MRQKYAKTSTKTLDQKIDVVAQFHAHKISPRRIAYRTGINITLVNQLIDGHVHANRFNALLEKHRKNRRDQRIKQSFKLSGIAQAQLQDKIEAEYIHTIIEK